MRPVSQAGFTKRPPSSDGWLAAVWFAIILLALNATARPLEKKPENLFADTVASNFTAWDTNHDKVLSSVEIAAAVSDPANKGNAAAALAVLSRIDFHRDEFPRLTMPAIRRIGLRVEPDVRAYFYECVNRINSITNRALFASGLPQLKTVHQGRFGNCFCLAPLGAALNRSSQDVSNWFQLQADGRIRVDFPGGPVFVPPMTDAELALTAGNSQDGVWINLFEKAIGQARNELKPASKRLDLPMEAIADGGRPEPILSYLTGHDVGGGPLGFTNENKVADVRKAVAAAAKEKRLIVAETGQHSAVPGIIPHHAYAILAYDKKPDTVTVWNPYGQQFNPDGEPGLEHGFPMTNGVFTMPFKEFVRAFGHVTIELPGHAPVQWLDDWDILAEAGQFGKAAGELTAVIALDPTEDWKLYMLTPLLIESGRTDEYHAHCKSMLNQFEKTESPSIAERTAKSCLLLTNAVSPEDLQRAVRLAAHAVEMSGEGEWLHWRLMTRGLAEYRAGKFDDVLKTEPLSRKALKHNPDIAGGCCEADTYFISAMAHEKLNQSKQARSDLKRGLKIVEKRLPQLDCGDLGYLWFDDLMTHIIMREAQATVSSP